IAANPAEAIAKAVNASVDMAMYVVNPDQWQSAIMQDVNSGAIKKSRINEAVGRILTLKFQLGLFDQPCVSDPNTPYVDANAANAVYVPDGDTAATTPADAYVVAVGEKAYAEGLGDNPAPQLPPAQKALIKTLESTGKPVIVVVIAGRPLGLGADAESANAI